MSLILRSEKGSKLSIEEVDNNFTYLDGKSSVDTSSILVPTEPVIISDNSTSLYAIALGRGNGEFSIGEINMPSLTTIGFIEVVSNYRLTSLDLSSLVTITSKSRYSNNNNNN